MRNLLITTLAGAGLLAMTTTAGAQYQPRQDFRYVQEREAQQGRVLDRVQRDLDRAHDNALPFTGDRNRVNQAREDVGQCQRVLADGQYDRRVFDNAIISLRRVIDMNRMSDNMRGYLSDDMRDLHRLQERLES